jgi:hypothetical protein
MSEQAAPRRTAVLGHHDALLRLKLKTEQT